MTIKSILCIFGGVEDELNALNTAMVLGRSDGARIRVLHVSPNPQAYAGIAGEGVYITGEILETIEKENKARMEKARQYVASFAAKHKIPMDNPEAMAHHVSVHFVHATGLADSTIGREGRVSDLIIIGGREETRARDAIVPALFNTARPVLVMPPGKGDMSPQWQNRAAALAWNGSLQAGRALYNALPLLSHGTKLYVLTVEGHRHARDLEAEAGLMEYLKAHGIDTQAILVAGGNYRTDGEALLQRVKELKADLLVMGAYGHSMFREMILGGMTEHMLRNADLPLLLSH